MNLKNYDSWKLATPYDNEPEIFESDIPKYYSCNEKSIDMFTEEVEKLAKLYGLHIDDSNAIVEYEESRREV